MTGLICLASASLALAALLASAAACSMASVSEGPVSTSDEASLRSAILICLSALIPQKKFLRKQRPCT